jgi:anti-sigma factor (TIGR02949 family)
MSEKNDVPSIEDRDCLEAMDHLYAYLNGELDGCPERFAVVEHHLSHCRSCFSRAEVERILNERIRKAGSEDAPATLRKRLRDLMDGF